MIRMDIFHLLRQLSTEKVSSSIGRSAEDSLLEAKIKNFVDKDIGENENSTILSLRSYKASAYKKIECTVTF